MNGAIGRGLVALALLSTLALAFAAPSALVQALLPPWRSVIEWLEPDFRVVELRSIAQGTESQIALVVTPARVIIVGDRAIVPDGDERAAASISRGTAWLLLTVYLVTLIAWPVRHGAREGLWRALLGVPVLCALLLLDVPINLLGPLRAMVNGIGAGEGGADTWVVTARFLRGGGRFLVAIAAAGGVGLLSQALAAPRPRP